MGKIGFLVLLIFFSGVQNGFAQTHKEFEQQMLQLFNQGKFSEAIPYAIKAKEAARKEYGDTASTYVLTLTNLAPVWPDRQKISAYN